MKNTHSCSSSAEGNETFRSLHLLVKIRIESMQLRGKYTVQPSVLSTLTVGTDCKHWALHCLLIRILLKETHLQFTISQVETHLSKITLDFLQPSIIMDLHLLFTRIVAPTQPRI